MRKPNKDKRGMQQHQGVMAEAFVCMCNSDCRIYASCSSMKAELGKSWLVLFAASNCSAAASLCSFSGVKLTTKSTKKINLKNGKKATKFFLNFNVFFKK